MPIYVAFSSRSREQKKKNPLFSHMDEVLASPLFKIHIPPIALRYYRVRRWYCINSWEFLAVLRGGYLYGITSRFPRAIRVLAVIGTLHRTSFFRGRRNNNSRLALPHVTYGPEKKILPRKNWANECSRILKIFDAT